VDLVDPREGRHLAVLYPVDKRTNADGRRRVVDPVRAPTTIGEPEGVAPLLASPMSEYAATGLPPAYLAGPEAYLHDDMEDDE